MNEPEHLVPAQNQLGETPIWAPEENALYWVDWGGGPTCRFEPATGKFTTFPVSLPVTALARRASGGWIAIAQNGLYAWDPKTNVYKLLVGPPEPDRPEICYNDAAVDRQGRLLVGTVNMQDPFAPEGSLYRLDPDGSLHDSIRAMPRRTALGSARMAGRYMWPTSAIARSWSWTMTRSRALPATAESLPMSRMKKGCPMG